MVRTLRKLERIHKFHTSLRNTWSFLIALWGTKRNETRERAKQTSASSTSSGRTLPHLDPLFHTKQFLIFPLRSEPRLPTFVTRFCWTFLEIGFKSRRSRSDRTTCYCEDEKILQEHKTLIQTNGRKTWMNRCNFHPEWKHGQVWSESQRDDENKQLSEQKHFFFLSDRRIFAHILVRKKDRVLVYIFFTKFAIVWRKFQKVF